MTPFAQMSRHVVRTTLAGPVLLAILATAQVAAAQVGEAPRDQAPPERLVDDNWTVILINGEESGWAHNRLVEIGDGEELRYRWDSESYDRMLNMGEVMASHQESWSLEDHRGRLLEIHARVEDSGDVTTQDLVLRGEEAVITTTTLGVPRVRTLPWEDEVLGSTGVWLQAVEHGTEPETCFSYRTFSLDVEGIGTNTRRVVGLEDVELLDGEVRQLLHVIETSTSMPGIEFEVWCDEELDRIKCEMSMGGLIFGEIRASEERAKRNEHAELWVDASDFVSARCDVNIRSLVPVDSIVYRLEAKDEALGVPTGLGDDDRQTILEDDGKVTTLLVELVTPPVGQQLSRDGHPEEFAEYLESSPLIQTDHPALRAKTLELVGERTDAWEVACLLERFVYDYIDNFDNAVGYASAGRVFESRAGDCTEHAVLLAAMARVAGLPSRIASGFTYGESTFWAHAWTEVWIGGEWYALDATRGAGGVDPGHIRFSVDSHQAEISAESWLADVQGFNLDVDIVAFTCGGRRHDAEDEFRTTHIEGDTFRNPLFGIGLTLPPGFEFVFDDELSLDEDPTLVILSGDPGMILIVERRQHDEEYRQSLEAEGWRVLSNLPQRVAGREGMAYMVEDEDGRFRALSFSNGRATFTLMAFIEDDERDLPVFQAVVQSIVFE